MKLLKTITDFHSIEAEVRNALITFDPKLTVLEPEDRENLKLELHKLFGNVNLRFCVFDALVKLDVAAAWEIIESSYFDINRPRGSRSTFVVSDLDLLLDSLVSEIGEDELYQKLSAPWINFHILKSLDLAEILEEIFSEETYSELISLRENTKRPFPLDELIDTLENLLREEFSREQFKYYVDRLYCDMRNELLIFKYPLLEKVFREMSIKLREVHLIYEDQYLYSDDFLEDQLDILKSFR